MSREGGRFETRYTDEDLLAGVRHVLERRLGLAAGEHLGQRPFDRARPTEGDWEHLPSARQIAGRLKRSWPEVVRIAWQTDGAPSFAHAAMTAQRAEVDLDTDDRQTIAALRTVAIHLDVATLTPTSYATGVQSLLKQARRDGTIEYWRELLPTANQVISANRGSWDLALAKAGLEIRLGAELGDRGLRHALAARRHLGLPETAPEHEEPARNAKPAAKQHNSACRSARPALTATPPESPTSDERVDAPEKPARGPKRGGTPRVYRTQLTAEQAIAEFVHQQGGWPTSRGALDEWSRIYEVAVQRIKGGTEPYLDGAAELLRAAGVTPPPRQVRVVRGRIARDLPRSERWPGRGRKQYTREECLDALQRRYANVPRGKKLTRAFYVAWPPGAHDAPSARVFDQFGGFAALRDEVHARRAAGTKRASVAE